MATLTRSRLTTAARSTTTRRILRCVATCAIDIALGERGKHETRTTGSSCQ